MVSSSWYRERNKPTATMMRPFTFLPMSLQGICVIGLLILELVRLFSRRRQWHETVKHVLVRLIASSATIVLFAELGPYLTRHILDLKGPEAAYDVSRIIGRYAWGFWLPLFGAGVLPQLLWLDRASQKRTVCFVVGTLALLADLFMFFLYWVTSLSRDFLLSSWDAFDFWPF